MTGLDLLLAFTATLLLGIGKSGIKGLGVVIVTLMALVFGGKASTGILMPMMITADIFKHMNIKFTLIEAVTPTDS